MLEIRSAYRMRRLGALLRLLVLVFAARVQTVHGNVNTGRQLLRKHRSTYAPDDLDTGYLPGESQAKHLGEAAHGTPDDPPSDDFFTEEALNGEAVDEILDDTRPEDVVSEQALNGEDRLPQAGADVGAEEAPQPRPKKKAALPPWSDLFLEESRWKCTKVGTPNSALLAESRVTTPAQFSVWAVWGVPSDLKNIAKTFFRNASLAYGDTVVDAESKSVAYGFTAHAKVCRPRA
eukprot:scaffold910_cov396-Prasinococcus_capsulatus_cf.AAC.39